VRKVVTRPKVLLLNSKKALSLKQADFQGCAQRRPIKVSVCTSIIVVSPGPFSPTSSTSAATRVPENTEEEPNDF